MTRRLLPLIAATALAAPGLALAQGTISAEIGANGLASTEARLAALPAPDATERFALGGVRFLGAVERALQERYATDISGVLAEESGIPILRLPLPPNPDATPFAPEAVPALFEQVVADMAGALEALDTITDADEVGLVIDTADLWFDINRNGARDDGEAVMDIVELVRPAQEFILDDNGSWVPAPQDARPSITVRFDTSDAAWLSAYAHLLSGIGETVLALDPAEAIATVLDARATMNALSPHIDASGGWWSVNDMADFVDIFAIFVHAIEQQPDVTHSRAAHAHFIGMIEDNKTFWGRVATETDDDMEWIPNTDQISALPVPFPDDLGPRWQAVLAEAEMVLTGELLVPVWRMGDGAGINIARMFQDPPPLDAMGLLQGSTFAPFLEEGPVMTGEAFAQFEQMLGGDAGLYMVILN